MNITTPKLTRSDPTFLSKGDLIPLAEPFFGKNEWKYVQECLDTGWVSSVGSYVEKFERCVAEYVGVRYAVATSSGTAALHLALLAAGVEPNDEVLVSSLSFIAPANAIRYVGAWPVFIDIEPEYWQIDCRQVEEFIRKECDYRNGEFRNRRSGRRIRALLPVHVLGHPVDLDPLRELCRSCALVLIEDAAESLGAEYNGKRVGGLGDLACLSFNGNKVITTGGGGMLLTNDASRAERARYWSTQAKDDPVESVHREIGYNYRLTNLQSALGCAQLEQLDDLIARKRAIATHYREVCEPIPGLGFMKEAPWARSSYWLSTITVDPLQYGEDSRALLQRLQLLGIQTRPLWQPLSSSPAHIASHRSTPIADQIHRKALNLPSSTCLTSSQQTKIVSALVRKIN